MSISAESKPCNSLAGKVHEANKRRPIGDETRDDLQVIKDIRNKFAHTAVSGSTSKSPAIRNVAEKFVDYTPKFDVKDLFDQRVSCVVAAIRTKGDGVMFDCAVSEDEKA